VDGATMIELQTARRMVNTSDAILQFAV
jgi:hypothetical protein